MVPDGFKNMVAAAAIGVTSPWALSFAPPIEDRNAIEIQCAAALRDLKRTLLDRGSIDRLLAGRNSELADGIFRDYAEAVGPALLQAEKSLAGLGQAKVTPAEVREAVLAYRDAGSSAIGATGEFVAQAGGERIDPALTRSRLFLVLVANWARVGASRRPEPDGSGTDVEAIVDGAMSEGGLLRVLGEQVRSDPGTANLWLDRKSQYLRAAGSVSEQCWRQDFCDSILLAAEPTSALVRDVRAAKLRASTHRRLLARENDSYSRDISRLAVSAGADQSAVRAWEMQYLREAYPSVVPSTLPSESARSLLEIYGSKSDRESLPIAWSELQAKRTLMWKDLVEDYAHWWAQSQIVHAGDAAPPQALVELETAAFALETSWVEARARGVSSKILRDQLAEIAKTKPTSAIAFMQRAAVLRAASAPQRNLDISE
ncbi:MAG: hypothetical protein SGJ09_15355 [Phycisphaerae bacterium]|nr:hypothetical protein [Phycisphaerae bacterium]